MTDRTLKPVAWLHEKDRDSAVITSPVRKLLADCYGEERVAAYSVALVPAPTDEKIRRIAHQLAGNAAVKVDDLLSKSLTAEQLKAVKQIVESAIREAVSGELK